MKGNEDILKNKGRPENKAPWRKLLKDTHLWKGGRLSRREVWGEGETRRLGESGNNINDPAARLHPSVWLWSCVPHILKSLVLSPPGPSFAKMLASLPP
jgi:hypothetical protein